MQEKNDTSINKNDINVEIEDKSEELTLPRGKRCWVFVFFVAMNIVCNMDNGFFPPATQELRRDFKMDDSILGIFGSVVYLGNLIGIINYNSRWNNYNSSY